MNLESAGIDPGTNTFYSFKVSPSSFNGHVKHPDVFWYGVSKKAVAEDGREFPKKTILGIYRQNKNKSYFFMFVGTRPGHNQPPLVPNIVPRKRPFPPSCCLYESFPIYLFSLKVPVFQTV
jgi:hypothetical protein